MFNELLMVLGAGPVLSLRADPTFGPLGTVFLLPYASALIGAGITAVWCVKVALLGPRR